MYQKKDISYWEQGKSLVDKNAVRNFTAEVSQTPSTQQVDVQESRQPEGNSDSIARNSCHQKSESYTLRDLKKLQKRELAAIFQMKLGKPPLKKKKVDPSISQKGRLLEFRGDREGGGEEERKKLNFLFSNESLSPQLFCDFESCISQLLLLQFSLF